MHTSKKMVFCIVITREANVQRSQLSQDQLTHYYTLFNRVQNVTCVDNVTNLPSGEWRENENAVACTTIENGIRITFRMYMRTCQIVIESVMEQS